MTTINKNSVKLGYVTAIDYFNNQQVAPTPGDTEWFTDHLVNSLASKDVWFFVTELYSTPTDYWGVCIMFNDGILIVDKFLVPHYFNLNPVEVSMLANINEDEGGLQEFYSNEIGISGGTGPLFLQIYNYVTYGNETWFLKVRSSSAQLYQGIINARTVLDSTLGSYNIKVDKIPYPLLEVITGLDQRTQFQVPITVSHQLTYTYERRGQKLYIPDTSLSRQRILELVNKKVVFAPSLS